MVDARVESIFAGWLAFERECATADAERWRLPVETVEHYLETVARSATLRRLAELAPAELRELPSKELPERYLAAAGTLRFLLATLALHDYLVDQAAGAWRRVASLVAEDSAEGRAVYRQVIAAEQAAALLEQAGEPELADQARSRAWQKQLRLVRPERRGRRSPASRLAFALHRTLRHDPTLRPGARERLIAELVSEVVGPYRAAQVHSVVQQAGRRARARRARPEVIAAFWSRSEGFLVQSGIKVAASLAEAWDEGVFSGARMFLVRSVRKVAPAADGSSLPSRLGTFRSWNTRTQSARRGPAGRPAAERLNAAAPLRSRP